MPYDELVKRLREEAECPDNYPEDSGIMREAADAIEELSTELECLKSYMGEWKAAYILEHDARTMDYKTDKEREASDNWKKLTARFGYRRRDMLSGDCNICINGKMPPYSATCVECGLSRKNYKPITNYERLIRKTPEELAEWLSRPPGTWVYKSKTEWLDWLKQEAKKR